MIRHFLAWFFYKCGDITSKVMDHWPCGFLHPYPLYSWFMSRSIDIDIDYKIWNGWQPDVYGYWNILCQWGMGQTEEAHEYYMNNNPAWLWEI